MSQNKAATVLGLGVLGVLAFVYYRNKGDNSLLEDKFFKALDIEKIKEKLIPAEIAKLTEQISTQTPFTAIRGGNEIRCTSSSCRRATDQRMRNNNEISKTIAELVGIKEGLNVNESLIL